MPWSGARARRASRAWSRSRRGCAKQDALFAIADRFADVYCSVGTHPHYAHEELDISTADLVARTRNPKVVAIGEAGLDYHYDNSPREAQERGFRTHIAAARETGLPLVIHSRDADDDMARILEEETGKGAFPAVLHCFTGGAEFARRAIALGLYISFTGILTFKNSAALRAIAAALPADRILVETDAPYLAPGKFRGKRNEPAFVVETANVLAETRGVSFDEIARQTTENFFRLFSKVPRPAAAAASADALAGRAKLTMTLKFTILGCGSSGGVPRPALGWGDCDPDNPKNRRRRTSLLVERRDNRRCHPHSGRHLARFARAAARCRGRLARCRVLHPRACRPHPRHRRPACAVHQAQRRRIDVYLDEHTAALMQERFGYCFKSPPGSDYPPIVTEHRLAPGRRSRSTGEGGAIAALPLLQEHGDIASLGFRFGNLAYSCDLSGMPPESVAALAGLDVWIVDALRYRPHPSHFSLDDALTGSSG